MTNSCTGWVHTSAWVNQTEERDSSSAWLKVPINPNNEAAAPSNTAIYGQWEGRLYEAHGKNEKSVRFFCFSLNHSLVQNLQITHAQMAAGLEIQKVVLLKRMCPF